MVDADALDAQLRALANPERARYERAYLKSPDALAHLGVSLGPLHALAAGVKKGDKRPDHEAVWALVDTLWDEPVHERRMLAILLLEGWHRVLVPADIARLERWLRDAHTWAYVDEISVHLVGPLIAEDPSLEPILDRWAADDNFWVARAAMLARLYPMRKGALDPHFERFAAHADPLLESREFFLRKAIGWILREVSKRDPDRVARWLEPRMNRASGVTIREAVKYLPENRRDALLALRETKPRKSRLT
jgi:3-methyladenine DNA glycosylase AlkD